MKLSVACMVVVATAAAATLAVEAMSPQQISDFYQGLQSVSVYDKRIRPNHAAAPVKVTVSAFVISLSDYDARNMRAQVDMYFRQAWNDSRLAHGGDSLFGGSELRELIWRPDTFFANSIKGSRHASTVDNTFVRISPSGEVLVSERLTQTIACPTFVNRVYCSLEMESCESLVLSCLPLLWSHQLTYAYQCINRRLQHEGHRVSVEEEWLRL